MKKGKEFQIASATLIATLGTEPQIVTASLDLLNRQQVWPSHVKVIHTSTQLESIRSAIQTLSQDFNTYPYKKPHTLEMLVVADETGTSFEDVESPPAIQAAFRTIYQAIWRAKRDCQAVHLVISGGRKALALYAMSAAQLLFDQDDKLWILISTGEFLHSRRLHPEAKDDVHLLSIPVILWSQVSPAFSALQQISDPNEALNHVRDLHLREKLENARTFVLGSLTPAEQRVVEILVLEGASDTTISRRLTISPRTAEQHLRSAYSKAAAHWDVDSISRTQLVSLLQMYFSTKLREIPHDEEK